MTVAIRKNRKKENINGHSRQATAVQWLLQLQLYFAFSLPLHSFVYIFPPWDRKNSVSSPLPSSLYLSSELSQLSHHSRATRQTHQQRPSLFVKPHCPSAKEPGTWYLGSRWMKRFLNSSTQLHQFQDSVSRVMSGGPRHYMAFPMQGLAFISTIILKAPLVSLKSSSLLLLLMPTNGIALVR